MTKKYLVGNPGVVVAPMFTIEDFDEFLRLSKNAKIKVVRFKEDKSRHYYAYIDAYAFRCSYIIRYFENTSSLKMELENRFDRVKVNTRELSKVILRERYETLKSHGFIDGIFNDISFICEVEE